MLFNCRCALYGILFKVQGIVFSLKNLASCVEYDFILLGTIVYDICYMIF